MTIPETIELILSREPDIIAAEDCYDMIRSLDRQAAIGYTKRLLPVTAKLIQESKSSDYLKAVELRKDLLLYIAPNEFDSFLQYIEYDRDYNRRFYLPRRKQLLPLVKILQSMADDELDELFLSTPPRIGKTTLILLFILWIMGRDSEKANLYSSYGDKNCKAFYTGALEVLTDKDTYLYYNVFPQKKIVHTDAKDELINLDRRKKYASLTCRSLEGALNGSCDCDGILVADDMIEGIETALSPSRLLSVWLKVDNNLLTRAKETAKIIWIGTRWALEDVHGVRLDVLKNEPKFAHKRFTVTNIPALDENDESNFFYQHELGFSTEYYQAKRASHERNNDMASWLAQYCGEPIEREGAVFNPDDMRFYNGELPNLIPDRIFMACDPAFGGSDFCTAAYCYQYGDEVYVHNVTYNNGEKTVTQPDIVNKIIQYEVQAARFEATKATASYKEEIEKALKAKGYRLNITTHGSALTSSTDASKTIKGKQARIFDKAAEIREFYFLEDGKRTKEYQAFMQNVYSFKVLGKNKQGDDAPDCLAMVADMAHGGIVTAVSIFRRTF